MYDGSVAQNIEEPEPEHAFDQGVCVRINQRPSC